MKKYPENYRRKVVSFDAFYFEKQQQLGKLFSMQEVFSHVADINLWGSSESVSGEGSTNSETKRFKEELIDLLAVLKIETLLDAPCGDFQWLSTVTLPVQKYIGLDILEHPISVLKQHYRHQEQYEFLCADISKDPLLQSDLILCRDCLVHFSFEDIFKTLKNFQSSGSHYLLTTTFTDCNENTDIVTGDWRTLNLQRPPFNFPNPQETITEGCSQNDGLYKDKSLALWRLDDLDRAALL